MRLSISKIQELTGQPLYKILMVFRDNYVRLENHCEEVVKEHHDYALMLTVKYLL